MEERIALAKALVQEIEQLSGVKRAWVDDWDRYGRSFSVFVTLDLDSSNKPRGKDFSMLKLTNGIRRIFGNRSFSIDPPKRTYERLSWRRENAFAGYDGRQIQIDLNL